MKSWPETVLTEVAYSFTRVPSSTLRRLNSGMSWMLFSSMDFMSYSAMSPVESMPRSFPSSSTMGRAVSAPSRMVRQASSMGTEPLRAGGWSKSRSRTWVRMLFTRGGASIPKRSSSFWVSSFTAPIRTAL